MASPAQIANDMEAQAAYWTRRHPFDLADACRDAARIIRRFLDNETVDGRTVAGIIGRLERFAGQLGGGYHGMIEESLYRAVHAIRTLQQEARDAVR